jgi:hypothetical protein
MGFLSVLLAALELFAKLDVIGNRPICVHREHGCVVAVALLDNPRRPGEGSGGPGGLGFGNDVLARKLGQKLADRNHEIRIGKDQHVVGVNHRPQSLDGILEQRLLSREWEQLLRSLGGAQRPEP